MTTHPKRILVVDDDPLVARTIARVLSRDYEVQTVDSGAKALKALAAGGFSGIVSDADMPQMNGPELYQKVLKLYPAMARRFVFFTANVDLVENLNVPVLIKGSSDGPKLLRRVQSIT